MHGKHPYNENCIEDQTIFRKWSSKKIEHPMYSSAIITWTIRDVEKRECAKKHNLNFKEVWNLEEGKEFIDNLYQKYTNGKCQS